MSATALSVAYTYAMAGAEYSPDWVYVTADEGSARAYASRYVDPRGRTIPGDVYEVRPEVDRPDPDYRHFPKIFRRCRSAVVTRVIATGIVLTPEECARLERSYKVWGDPDSPVWDENGIINPSPQMTENGATREWTEMLRPWLPITDIDGTGKLSCASGRRLAGTDRDPADVLVDVVTALDRDCQITRTGFGRYRCTVCGATPRDEAAAARHQLGDRAVELLTRVHDLASEPLGSLAAAAARRSPDRWDWLPR